MLLISLAVVFLALLVPQVEMRPAAEAPAK